jgi:hypothetical protein
VLVVDLDALGLVHAQHLGHDVELRDRRVVEPEQEQLRRVERALHERLAALDATPERTARSSAAAAGRAPRRDLLVAVGGRVGRDRDARRARYPRGDHARDLREHRGALRVARLEQLDDARQAVRDVGAGDAALVERPHGELVPGSPIDWAATMPTASPISLISPVARLKP